MQTRVAGSRPQPCSGIPAERLRPSRGEGGEALCAEANWRLVKSRDSRRNAINWVTRLTLSRYRLIFGSRNKNRKKFSIWIISLVAPQKLSQTNEGKAWLEQFDENDRHFAAVMLDEMLLLNQEQVTTSIRSSLDRIASNWCRRKKRIALYVEREFQESAFFKSQIIADNSGVLRTRAVGMSGPPAVKPIRGQTRVGSEGLLAFAVSQQTEALPKIFMNNPGPDRLRAKTAPAGEIVIVTDFIGSGNRVKSILDMFWAVPTIRSWVSRKLVKFRVIAAAATSTGASSVRTHRTRPNVSAEWIAPTIWSSSPRNCIDWEALIRKNGPSEGRDGCGRYGFNSEGALIAFSYRIPNNTPAMIHHSFKGWRALFTGPAPVGLQDIFGVRSWTDVVDEATANVGLVLGRELTDEDRATMLFLTLLRGRWHKDSATALSSRTGMSVHALLDIRRKALQNELITDDGRLTDKGYQYMAAGELAERIKPIVATNQEPYYPESLRSHGSV